MAGKKIMMYDTLDDYYVQTFIAAEMEIDVEMSKSFILNLGCFDISTALRRSTQQIDLCVSGTYSLKTPPLVLAHPFIAAVTQHPHSDVATIK